MGQAPVLKSHKSQLCFTNKFILTFPFIIFSYLLKCIIDNLTADQYIPKNFIQLDFSEIGFYNLCCIHDTECMIEILKGHEIHRIKE